MRKKEIDHLLQFVSEAGLLKRVKRSGWWVLGIQDPESVAEHSFRCAILGYVLAQMEGVAPYKALLMTLFNDLQEARISDLHKMSQHYIQSAQAEEKAFQEQISKLPGIMKDELSAIHREYKGQQTHAALIARDADILECLIQAKEYQEHGFTQAFKFMKKAPAFLKTKSAKKLWRQARVMPLNTWWEKLSDFHR
ncbi:MAG: HD domain-containing protein [Candidatus Omnitrophota bacterium]